MILPTLNMIHNLIGISFSVTYARLVYPSSKEKLRKLTRQDMN
jgi:hypothetical protein